MPEHPLKRNGVLILSVFLLLSVAHVYYLGIFDGATIFKGIYFNFVSTLTIILLMTLLLAKARIKSQIVLNVNQTDIAILIFVLYLSIHTYYFKTAYADRLISFLLVLITYFFFKTIFSSSDHDFLQRSILAILLTCGLIQTLIGIFQVSSLVRSLNPYFKLTGSFDNPGPYTVYLISILPFSLCISLFLKTQTRFDKVIKVLSGSYCVIAPIIITFSGSRTAWVFRPMQFAYHLFLPQKTSASFSKIDRLLASKGNHYFMSFSFFHFALSL
jgi:hypothetical protein